MDKIKVDNFLGLYTNVDESKLNPEYQSEAVNVRFRTGYVESEGYIASEAVLPANVIYAQMVTLDEDKLKNRVDESGVLIPDYVQNLSEYMFSVIKDNDKLRIFIDDIEVFYYDHLPVTANSVIKIWNKNGIVTLLTDLGTYWIGKINRLTTYPTLRTPGFYCYKFVDLSYYPLSPTISSGLFADDTLPVTLKLINTQDFIIPGSEEPYKFRAYKIEASYPNGRVKSEYTLIAWEANGQYEIAKINMVIPIGTGVTIKSGDFWNTFKSQIISPSNWEPHNSFNQIEEIITATGLKANLVFADENQFIKTKTEFIITYIFDDRDEYAMNYFIYEHTQGTKYVLKLENFVMPGINSTNKNYRISGIALYIRQDEKDDFEQVQYWDINKGTQDVSIFDVLYIDGLSTNGIYASQTIGAVYKPKEYKPINKFTDYIEIDGIAYAMSDQRVYHPSIGSGMIMNGVFLDYVPEVEGDLLSDVNGTLGVFGSQLKLVIAQDSKEGYLLFSIKDKMNFQIRDQYDLATSPEGIIIHTKRGIYVTNGYERKIISEEINNLVESNFDTGNISYSPADEMLFYTFKSGNEYYTFRYDFIYGKWSEIKPGIPGKLTFSESGIIHYLNESEGKVYKLDTTKDVYSAVRTPNVDLDYPFLGKNLIYIDVDFEGMLSYENYTITHTSRRTARLGIPVSKRIPNALIGARFIFKGKIYTIDIYYDAIGEFRHENHIPSPETIPEGI